MPTRTELSRNNIRAGMFVSIGLLLALAVIVILTDAIEALKSYDQYTVLYEIDEGVANLQRGSEVRVGGVALGRVTEVEPRLDDSPLETIAVRFKLDSSVTLYADASVLVTSPIIGSGSWLAIPNVGTPAQGPPPGGVIDGTSAAGLLGTLVGPENAAKTDVLVANWVEFSDFLARVPAEYDEHVVPILDDGKAITGDVRGLAGRVRNEDWPRWADGVDRVMEWATETTATLDEAFAAGRDTLVSAQRIAADNEKPIATTIDNVKAASTDVRALAQKANEQTLEKVHAFIQTGQDALDDATAAIQTLREDYEQWAVDLGDTLANASLASKQLKLATVEVRRSPWKLLYRPGRDELEHELLYESTRSFALAAADLSAAAASVDRVLARHGERLQQDEAAFQRIKQNLQGAFDNYERAQQRLFEVLVADSP